MVGITVDPSPRPSSLTSLQRKHIKQQIFFLLCLSFAFMPVSSFRNSCVQTLAFHTATRSPTEMSRSDNVLLEQGMIQRWTVLSENIRKQSPPRRIVAMSVTNMESDLNSSIEELESLRRERKTSTTQQEETGQSSPAIMPDSQQVDEKQQPHQQRSSSTTNGQPKPTLKTILNKPLGELTQSNLSSLCNSIRHTRKGSSFHNLGTLERILLEIDHNNGGSSTGRPILKSIHVFSLLTALSGDIRSWKQQQHGNRRKFTSSQQIDVKDIQRLVNVVTLLSEQRKSSDLAPGCYTEDVPSFATMIAAKASWWEETSTAAVDAALLFLGMVEKEDSDKEWDPRLIGSVVDALARVGRAEEAQALMGRAMGVDIPYFDSRSNNDVEKEEEEEEETNVSTSDSINTKRLDPSHASPCYDALLRAWSKKALLSSQSKQPDNNPAVKERNYQNAKKKKITPETLSSMAQARHILLNHIPSLQSSSEQQLVIITNKTCTAVLQGYALGLGVEAENTLMELEALHLSPLYSTSSLSSTMIFSSSLDVANYNTVLHAYSQSQDSDNVVSSAEILFTSMKEQTPLSLSVKTLTIKSVSGGPSSSAFSVIPPHPDFISYSSMLNCYSKHGMVDNAEKLLDEMNEKGYVPNAACFLPVIQGLEHSNDASAPDRVLSLIERSNRSLKRPNRLLYIAALRCMRRHGRGMEAEIILERFHQAYPNRGCPDVYSYMLVLRAWEKTKPKSNRQIAAKRAKIFFFDDMEKRVEASLLPTLDVNAYNIILNCYARAGEADDAEQLLTSLEDWNVPTVQPNSKSYSLAIKALANSDAKDSVHRAWKVMYRLGFPLHKPVPFNVSIDNFNSMLKLFAKRGMASDAEALLNNMGELVVDGTINSGGPDIQSYEAVLEALGRCGDAPDAPSRAEALMTRLEVMNELKGGDVQPISLLAYNTLLNCYANAGMAGKAERLLERLNDADSFSFGSTIKAIANSGASQLVAISRAESLAKTITGNEVIFAHRLKLAAKFGMGSEAEQLIQQMLFEHVNPGVIHYTAAMNAWAKSTDVNALSRAEMLWKQMEEMFELDRGAYHGLLLNYSTRGNSKKARLFLQRMLDSPNNVDVKPCKVSFTMVMDAYARSKSSNAGQKAEELLDQMRELHATGNHDVEVSITNMVPLLRWIIAFYN